MSYQSLSFTASPVRTSTRRRPDLARDLVALEALLAQAEPNLEAVLDAAHLVALDAAGSCLRWSIGAVGNAIAGNADVADALSDMRGNVRGLIASLVES